MHEDFVRANTVVQPAALVPELRLHVATEITPLWTATEAFLRVHDIEPPYWAFCWPGSQALARFILDNPERYRGRRAIDFAAGGGLAAMALVKVGATVTAVEIDPLAGVAMRCNAALNDVSFDVHIGDICEGPVPAVDALFAGDVCYSRPMVDRILPFFRRCAAAGVEVILADPGRAYVPAAQVERVAAYEVPTLLELEDKPQKRTELIRLLAL